MNDAEPTRARRLLSQPLLHFVLIGALAVAAGHGRGTAEPVSETTDRSVHVSADDVERWSAEWEARWKRPPTPDELEALVRARVREEVLYREALAMGLDRENAVVRRVLVRELETLTRELVELSLAPTDQDLAAWFAEHGELYRPPPLLTLTQVFVDPDRRGERTIPDANAMLEELSSLDPSSERAQRIGDPFMLQRYYPEKTQQRIGALFGSEFAAAVFELEPGRWHGPVLSGYGTHLVYVHALRTFDLPALADVKEQVTEDWVAENRTRITEKYFAETIGRYDVIVEGRPELDVRATSK